MPDYGLTLPDHDLTPNEFKELARRIGRAAFVPLFLRYYERVVTSEATIEEQRRGLADIARWTNIEEDRKVDPNANLPVFNIIFGQAGTSAASIEAVEVIQPPTHDPPHVPTNEADTDAALTMIPPEMLRSFASEMKEIADGQETHPASAPAVASGPDAPAAPAQPRRRTSARHRAQALPLQPAGLSGPAEVQDGEPKLGLQVPPQVTHPLARPSEPPREASAFKDSLAALDSALGF